MRSSIRVATVALCISLFSSMGVGCSSTSVAPEGRQTKRSSQTQAAGKRTPTPAEAEKYKEIETLLNRNSISDAEAAMTSFERRFSESPLLSSVENLHGLTLLRQKKSGAAIEHFNRALFLSADDPSLKPFILYNRATAEFDLNRTDDAQNTISQINLDALDKSNRIKVHYLKASIFDRESLAVETARQLLTAGRYISSVESHDVRKTLERFLEKSLQKIQDSSAMEKMLYDFEDSALVDGLLFNLGVTELKTGTTEKGTEHLKLLMSRFPQSNYFAQAKDALAHTKSGEANPQSIGVLLPMKGKFAKYAARTLQAIQLAFGIFGPQPDSKLTLVVENSGEEPEQAIAALDRLATKHHVIAVIGPMLTKGVDQISKRAQELNVPLISLARKSSPPLEYVFQGGLTQQLQANELARYSIQELGLKKFALIYPNEKYETEISQYFWEAVESYGGTIVGTESYAPGETDFRQAVDRLAGLYYTAARQREVDELAKERDLNKVKKRTRKTEHFYSLKPIVDFDAVFVADEPKVAGQILPTFAYRDVENVRFLGTSAWNTPEFLARTQSYSENSLFVEAFFPEENSQRGQQFSETYRTIFGQDPTTMEALAHDAGLILKEVLNSSSHPTNRADLRDRLSAVRDLNGVTGKITYKDGHFFRDLRVVSVRGGRFSALK